MHLIVSITALKPSKLRPFSFFFLSLSFFLSCGYSQHPVLWFALSLSGSGLRNACHPTLNLYDLSPLSSSELLNLQPVLNSYYRFITGLTQDYRKVPLIGPTFMPLRLHLVLRLIHLGGIEMSSLEPSRHRRPTLRRLRSWFQEFLNTNDEEISGTSLAVGMAILFLDVFVTFFVNLGTQVTHILAQGRILLKNWLEFSTRRELSMFGGRQPPERLRLPTYFTTTIASRTLQSSCSIIGQQTIVRHTMFLLKESGSKVMMCLIIVLSITWTLQSSLMKRSRHTMIIHSGQGSYMHSVIDQSDRCFVSLPHTAVLLKSRVTPMGVLQRASWARKDWYLSHLRRSTNHHGSHCFSIARSLTT